MSNRRGFKPPRVVKINFLRVLLRMCSDVNLDEKTKSYCLARLNGEGVGFLTRTLPKLSKAVVRSLEVGYFIRPTDFAWQGRSLRVFRGLLCEIFDEKGFLREDPNPVAIRDIRQFCDYFYKLVTKFDDSDLQQASQKYEKHEEDLSDRSVHPSWASRVRRNFETHYSALSRATAPEILSVCRPRDTPGSYYGSEHKRSIKSTTGSGLIKNLPWYVIKHIPSAATNRTVPYALRHWSGFFKAYPSSPEKLHIQKQPNKKCKVLFVPKDARGPRVISKEPLHELRAQMSFFDFTSKSLEKLTDGRINFRDQSISQALAREGSETRKWATLDLKDASDSVLYAFVKSIFRYSPGLYWFITRLRTPIAVLNNKEIAMKKLSGMGSGLTFPTMALLIHLSVCTNVSLKTGLPYKEVSKKVYVYGDDLIVPNEWFDYAVEGLTFSQLRVNTDKSFSRGFFRESCGGDFFKGVSVAPVRLRLSNAGLGKLMTLSKRFYATLIDGGILQLERHCRELVDAGLHQTANYYYDRLERVLGTLPVVGRSSSVLGRYMGGDFVNSKVEPAYVPYNSSANYSDFVCPYKHLGRTLAPSGQSVSDFEVMFDTDQDKSFGEISSPRNVKLRYKLVSLDKSDLPKNQAALVKDGLRAVQYLNLSRLGAYV